MNRYREIEEKHRNITEENREIIMTENRYERNDTMKKIGDIVIEHDTMANMIHDLKDILQAHGLSETPDRKDLLMDAYLAGVLYGRSVKAH